MASDRKISVVGLGYVGLPVAVEFAKHGPVIGFDNSSQRVEELKKGIDQTDEVDASQLQSPNIKWTSSPADLVEADFHIVAVPTPVTEAKRPDLSMLHSATETIARVLKAGDIVVFESTVYPGAIEETCLPILEKISGLKSPQEFKVGYSPERINPGDREHTLDRVVKVVSGQDDLALDIVAETYSKIIAAGVHRAPSIKVAEAAKVIENIQRDVNIAFMNELSLIFNRLGIDTRDVLDAAGTKWNFLKFTPGLVGGHCIGVDPYYLTHKAAELGHNPQIILAGRNINDGMGYHVAHQTIKKLLQCGHPVNDAVVTVLGLTFKPNVPDVRNTRVTEIVRELEDHKIEVQVVDPRANAKEVEREYGIQLKSINHLKPAQAIVYAVPHQEFEKIGWSLMTEVASSASISQRRTIPVIDVASRLDREKVPEGFLVWRL